MMVDQPNGLPSVWQFAVSAGHCPMCDSIVAPGALLLEQKHGQGVPKLPLKGNMLKEVSQRVM